MAIIAALQRHGVRYVVVGGVAAILHGAPTVTVDFDLSPERSEENLAHLAEALVDLGATRVTDPTDPGPPGPDSFQFRIESFDTPVGAVDVVLEAVRVGGYERLRPRAVTVLVANHAVSVAALEDLITIKQWSDRPKDRLHLRALLTVQQELAEREDGPTTPGRDGD